MAEILHQLRLVAYPIIYKVYTSQVVVWDFLHQQYLLPKVVPFDVIPQILGMTGAMMWFDIMPR